MKSQASVMEYLVLVLMIVFIAIIALFLIFGFQFFTVGSEQLMGRERRSLFLLQSFISSTALTNLQYQKGSVFDDSKLTGAACDDLETLLGPGLWAEIMVILDESVCDNQPVWKKRKCLSDLRKQAGTACTKQNYPVCGVWRFCEQNKRDRMIYRSIPVNVYRKMNNTVELGVLTVGVQSGQGGA